MRTVLLNFLVWSAFAALAGCGAPPKDPAVQAYERFVAAIRAGSGPHVWRALTPDSQRQLAALLDVAADDEKAVLEKLAVRPGWPFELDLPRKGRPIDGGSAEVRHVGGTLGERSWTLRVVKVKTAWRIDLFGSRADP